MISRQRWQDRAGTCCAGAPYHDKISAVDGSEPAHRAADRGGRCTDAPHLALLTDEAAPADIRERLRQAVGREPWVAEWPS